MLQSFLLTCSMDGTIKIWCPGSGGSEVINATPEFKYPEDEAPAGGGRNYRQQVGDVACDAWGELAGYPQRAGRPAGCACDSNMSTVTVALPCPAVSFTACAAWLLSL